MSPPIFFFASNLPASFPDVFTTRLLVDNFPAAHNKQAVYDKLADPANGNLTALELSHFIELKEFCGRGGGLPQPPVINQADRRRWSQSRAPYGISGPCMYISKYAVMNTPFEAIERTDEKAIGWEQLFHTERELRSLTALSSNEEFAYASFNAVLDAVVERNAQCIRAADVVSLEIDPEQIQPKALASFGQGFAERKICIVYFVGTTAPVAHRKYCYLMRQSLMSFYQVNVQRANEVIAAHPRLPFGTYSQYDCYLHNLMNMTSIVYMPRYTPATIGIRYRTAGHAQLRSVLWEWRRVAVESRHHPLKKRRLGEFDVCADNTD